MNRVTAGFFSMSHHATSGHDRPYLEWHQLDHMPEQYQLPGIVLGQRWASTAACHEARLVATDSWSQVEHVVCYLMGEPLEQTVDDFFALGSHLADVGRFPLSLPSQYVGCLSLVESRAAARVLVSAEVVPFRPHRGIYLIVEDAAGGSGQGGRPQQMHAEILHELNTVPGVAGTWTFATGDAIRSPRFTSGEYRMTVCYLDDEPAAVGTRIGSVLQPLVADPPSHLVLAAPFESMMRWDWNRF